MGYYLEINYVKKGEKMSKEVVSKRKIKKANIWLVIALCIMSALFITSTVLWLTNMSKVNKMDVAIDNVYQRNFYDFVDNNFQIDKVIKVINGSIEES